MSFLKKIFGSKNDRVLKSYFAKVPQINALENQMKALSDAELQAQTTLLKQKLAQGATLDDILCEAFAVCREAGRRVLNMRHFDVQLIGGMVLHDGRISEMKTGEGKTLVATLPVYLNALAGQGVHVVTVNDYLARRDSEWMGKIYQFLGLTVGVIVHGLNDAQRQQAYKADITYGTNNEFGFDYLRDNMKFSLKSMVQRPLNYAIVDEVDSILIDEARTPLIISGASEKSTDKYLQINPIIPYLKNEEHYKVDEKSRSAVLTEAGVSEVEKRLKVDNLFDPAHIELVHHVNQALKAHVIFKRDVDYVVKDGEVVIVDEFTGRMMPGRRWSDGLHQAVEAKEGVKIEAENQTLASITFQNYFRLYKKLSGMTGTADTEATELAKIYNLDVVVIPSHRHNQRDDQNDVIFKTERAKFKAIVEEVKTEVAKGRPILIGTIAIEKSERLSEMLSRAGINHKVLNAKHHEKEAEIIAQAGRYGAVTVSTNMAGRGTDIVLGGNPEFMAKAVVNPEENPEAYQVELEKFKAKCVEEQKKVVASGGLYVIGTERHESRRIDNQLRGRSGRQGDPGQTRFFISLEDDLMRIFGSDRIGSMMERIGMSEDDVIEHKWITSGIEKAQKKVEAHNFDIRKNVLEYDDVMNQQRITIYNLRREILAGETLEERFTDLVDTVVAGLVEQVEGQKSDDIDTAQMDGKFYDQFGFHFDWQNTLQQGAQAIGQKMYDDVVQKLNDKKDEYTPQVFMQAVRYFMLQTLDELWKDHLLTMDHLRQGIGLRGYNQKDPKLEYKREGFVLFQTMMRTFAEQAVMRIYKVRIQKQEDVEIQPEETRKDLVMSHGNKPQVSSGVPAQSAEKSGRNDPCPCGSGKKYKKCHGAEEAA